ncbi:uncharacterized protein [Procambarus clarkii]|uniref:uncharacterized protein n=1 Tax=Procambarus clarkii TaxID=6728 RepID=UPI00374202AD
MQNKNKSASNIGPLRKGDGTFTDDNKEMSEILRFQYNTVFTEPLNTLKINDPNEFFLNVTPTSNYISDVTLSSLDLEVAIDSMLMHSAPGPDSWNSVFIKKCKIPFSQALNIFWRRSLNTEVIPDILKTAEIAPLHTRGSKTDAKHYRPIAVTSHITWNHNRYITSPNMGSEQGTPASHSC